MTLLISSEPNIQKVAVIHKSKTVDYFESRDFELDVGSIYKAKVKNIIPGLKFLFLDLGGNLSGFMKNVETNEFHLGQHLMVQVATLPYKNKLARVSLDISIQGLTSVYMPKKVGIGISKEIEDEEVRNKLVTGISELEITDGVILRSYAKKSAVKTIGNEITYLKSTYENVKKVYSSKKSIGLVYRDSPLPVRVIKNFAKFGITKVYSDNKSLISDIELFLKTFALKVSISLYDTSKNIFDQYDIKDRLKKAFFRKIYLPSGGHIIFDEAEGFVLIDVNTGSFLGKKNVEKTILKTNLEAALETCIQLRIRNYSGIILIDFIDMDQNLSKKKLLNVLHKELKKDIARTNLIGFTRLGLIEMTRRRTGVSLNEMYSNTCPHCMGKGVLSTKPD